MKIRQVEAIDLDTCYQLESICFPEEEAASKENIQTRILKYPEGFYVLEDEGTIIGHINSGCTNKKDISDEAFKALTGHDPDGKNAVIFSVAIAPNKRGEKYGHHLLHHFMDVCKTQNKQCILLLCKTDLIPYYESAGFSYSNLSQSTHGGAQWHQMKYIISNC